MPANNAQSIKERKHITAQFNRVVVFDGCDRAVCKHCGMDRAWNTTNFCEKHLKKYTKYQELLALEERRKPKASAKSMGDFFKPVNSTTNELFAMAIYTSTANFSMFETPQWQAFFDRIGFTPSNRNQLSGELLTSVYESIKEQVLQVASNADHIQLVCDGSANISKVRIENVSFLVKGRSYYWKSTEIGAQTASAKWSVTHIKQSATEITFGNLRKWTAFSSDTNAT